ncbi:MAG TPA: hypothetical protein VMA37_06700 [Acetobacteraceae bacterium]|nr:hypothetical protein [Acetobacteraceae bacterium]
MAALKPKSILFCVAFVPQFLLPCEPLLSQILALKVIFLFLGTMNAAFYAITASAARQMIHRPKI